MPIIIKKKSKSAPIQDGELVEGALVPQATATPKAPERSAADAVKDWKDVPPPGAKPRTCEFCKNDYVKPCTKANYEGCQNWRHLQSPAGNTRRKILGMEPL
jgi:hypothetical protein